MKKQYPYYTSNRNNPESEKVFNSFSKKNKTAILNFLDRCSIVSKSDKRAGNRKRALVRFFDFLDNKDVGKITNNDVVEVAKAISNSRYGTDTRNSDRNFITKFLKGKFPDWADRFSSFEYMKYENKKEENRLESKDLITPQELEKLIKATTDLKYKAMIILIYESAGRSEEILKLKWNDIDFKDNLVYLYSGKTGKKRYVPINDSVSHLKRLRDETDGSPEDYVFPSATGSKLTNACVNMKLKRLSEKAGIQRKIFLYMFRHTRLSQLITKLSPKVYEQVSGHSLKMGMRTYAHLNQDQIIQEMNDKIFDGKGLTVEDKNKIAELEKQISLLSEQHNITLELLARALEQNNPALIREMMVKLKS